jgi:hypothetical protein
MLQFFRGGPYFVTVSALPLFIRWGGWLGMLFIAVCQLVLIARGGIGPSPAIEEEERKGRSQLKAETDQLPQEPGAESLIPIDGAAVDIMEVVFPPRYLEIFKKMQMAIAKDREWFLSFVKSAAPGEPLPYDPRFGITKDEFDEMRKLGKRARLIKVKTVKLHVVKEGRVIAFDGGKDLPELTGVKLDLAANVVTTPFGEAKESSRIEATEEQKLTGPWNGLQWKLEQGSERPLRFTIAKLALGKLQKSGRGILYYDASHFDGRLQKTVQYVLSYDLQPPTK